MVGTLLEIGLLGFVFKSRGRVSENKNLIFFFSPLGSCFFFSLLNVTFLFLFHSFLDGIYDFVEAFKCEWKNQRNVETTGQLQIWKSSRNGSPAVAGGADANQPCWSGETGGKEVPDQTACQQQIQAPQRCYALALANPRCSRAGLTEITMKGHGKY